MQGALGHAFLEEKEIMCFSNPLILGTRGLCNLFNMKAINMQDHLDLLKLQQKNGGKKFDVGHKQLCWRQESKVTTGHYFGFYSDNFTAGSDFPALPLVVAYGFCVVTVVVDA